MLNQANKTKICKQHRPRVTSDVASTSPRRMVQVAAPMVFMITNCMPSPTLKHPATPGSGKLHGEPLKAGLNVIEQPERVLPL